MCKRGNEDGEEDYLYKTKYKMGAWRWKSLELVNLK